MSFLGHIVYCRVIQWIDIIQTWSNPTSVTEVSSFLGLAGYYRRFIPDFQKLQVPKPILLKKSKFCWTPECQTAFEKVTCKKLLTPAPI